MERMKKLVMMIQVGLVVTSSQKSWAVCVIVIQRMTDKVMGIFQPLPCQKA